ncbi:MAG: hypothetical protein Q8J66_08840 [Methylotenera sp.]|nr:hypothetical protein [Methylotenera sp.]
MNSPYLMQTGIVERLLEAVVIVMPTLPEGESKQNLMEAMDVFKEAITPSALFLSEVHEYLSSHSITIGAGEAVQLLENAAYDIDLNHASDAVIYHVDEYLLAQ